MERDRWESERDRWRVEIGAPASMNEFYRLDSGVPFTELGVPLSLRTGLFMGVDTQRRPVFPIEAIPADARGGKIKRFDNPMLSVTETMKPGGLLRKMEGISCYGRWDKNDERSYAENINKTESRKHRRIPIFPTFLRNRKGHRLLPRAKRLVVEVDT